MRLIIQSEDIYELQRVFQECSGETVPLGWLANFIIKNKSLACEWYLNGIDDTCTKDTMINGISNELIGKSWPTYGDSNKDPNAFDNFVSELKESISAIKDKNEKL